MRDRLNHTVVFRDFVFPLMTTKLCVFSALGVTVEVSHNRRFPSDGHPGYEPAYAEPPSKGREVILETRDNSVVLRVAFMIGSCFFVVL